MLTLVPLFPALFFFNGKVEHSVWVTWSGAGGGGGSSADLCSGQVLSPSLAAPLHNPPTPRTYTRPAVGPGPNAVHSLCPSLLEVSMKGTPGVKAAPRAEQRGALSLLLRPWASPPPQAHAASLGDSTSLPTGHQFSFRQPHAEVPTRFPSPPCRRGSRCNLLR